MPIQPMNLDTATLDGIRVLVHSIRAGGKTHLAGDFLKEESKVGPVAYINTAGEGFMTIQSIGLGNVMYRVTSLKEYNEVIASFVAKPLHAIAVDSAQILEQFCMWDVMGTDKRSPMSTKEKNEWVDINREFYNALRQTCKAAKMFFMTAPSAINADPITGAAKMISPDLIGQRALGIAGSFEFVGYIKLLAKGGGNVERSIQFAPDGVTLVRQQSPKPITADIKLPQVGGWAAVKSAIINGLTESK